jgi:hypothetical protein
VTPIFWTVTGIVSTLFINVATLIWAVSWRGSKMAEQLISLRREMERLEAALGDLTRQVKLLVAHEVQIRALEHKTGSVEERLHTLELRQTL